MNSRFFPLLSLPSSTKHFLVKFGFPVEWLSILLNNENLRQKFQPDMNSCKLDERKCYLITMRMMMKLKDEKQMDAGNDVGILRMRKEKSSILVGMKKKMWMYRCDERVGKLLTGKRKCLSVHWMMQISNNNIDFQLSSFHSIQIIMSDPWLYNHLMVNRMFNCIWQDNIIWKGIQPEMECK